jgi:hypothetical protein
MKPALFPGDATATVPLRLCLNDEANTHAAAVDCLNGWQHYPLRPGAASVPLQGCCVWFADGRTLGIAGFLIVPFARRAWFSLSLALPPEALGRFLPDWQNCARPPLSDAFDEAFRAFHFVGVGSRKLACGVPTPSTLAFPRPVWLCAGDEPNTPLSLPGRCHPYDSPAFPQVPPSAYRWKTTKGERP